MNTKHVRASKTPVRRGPQTGHPVPVENHQQINKTSVTGRPHLTCLPKHRGRPQKASRNPGERWKGLITLQDNPATCACQPSTHRSGETKHATSFTFSPTGSDSSVTAPYTHNGHEHTQPRWHATANARPMSQASAAHRACRPREIPMMNPTRRHTALEQQSSHKYCGRFATVPHTTETATNTTIQGGPGA